MQDLISVIVPVYKVEERLLRKSIESIVEQTYRNIELLIVDDGSPDNCGIICDEYSSNDTRIHVFHIENAGVSAARNYALDRVKGNFICFVDSDDYLEHDALEKMLHEIKSNDCNIVMCSANHIIEKDNRCITSKTQNSNVVCLKQNEAIESLCYFFQPFEGYDMNTVWGKLFRREIIDGIRFNPLIRIGEDFEFMYKVLQNVQLVSCMENKLYNYLIRDNSAMRNGFDENKLNSITELKKLLIHALPEYKAAVQSRVCNIAIVVLFMVPVGKDYKSYRKPIIDFINENRSDVIHNKKTRKKVKVALILSHFGFGFVQRVFQIINRSK